MKDMCTPMFIAALFIIARTWKQPGCPSADEWIRKLWYIYTMEYYSAIVQVRCTMLDAWGWCTGTNQRDGMGREEGGGFRMGNTCIPVVDSF